MTDTPRAAPEDQHDDETKPGDEASGAGYGNNAGEQGDGDRASDQPDAQDDPAR